MVNMINIIPKRDSPPQIQQYIFSLLPVVLFITILLECWKYRPQRCLPSLEYNCTLLLEPKLQNKRTSKLISYYIMYYKQVYLYSILYEYARHKSFITLYKKMSQSTVIQPE